MERRLMYGLAVFLAGVLLFPVLSSRADNYDQGKNIYENNCQMCHGANGKGDGPAAAAFNPHPQNFTEPKFWEQKNVDKIITDTIEQGHGLMPPINLKSNEIKTVIDYIHTFKPRSP
jgi:high-affinity iron transporter